MVMTASTMLTLGTAVPQFELADTGGLTVSSADFPDARGLLVVFMCPHCPFVKHIRKGLARFGREYQERGLAMVAINSNDIAASPDDGPEQMREEAREEGYTFPYLFDETQAVAKSFHAACTPDFFLLDADRSLIYRGQFDSSRPGNDVAVTGSSLRAAADALLAGRSVPEDQRSSIGCNIKWKEFNAPDYFTGEPAG
jgi:peroxiredoxin